LCIKLCYIYGVKRNLTLGLFLLLFSVGVFGQEQAQYSQGKPCVNKAVQEKTDELIADYAKLGFYVYRGEYLTMENKTEMPIYLQLIKNRVYHIIVVGDPNLQRMEVKLGHAAFGGNEVNDQIIKGRDKTYFTHFNYIPPFTGPFLFTVYEKVINTKTFCTSVFVLVREDNLTAPSN
jgi:hypothetical protein